MIGATVFPAILSALVAASGLPAACVSWQNRRQSGVYVDPVLRQRVTALVIALSDIGDQYQTWQPAAVPADGLVETAKGIQRMTLQIRCESLDETDSASALVTADNVRRRLFRTSLRETLREAHVSVWGVTPTQNISGTADDRCKSIYTFDAILGIAWAESDTANPISWIETVSYTGSFS